MKKWMSRILSLVLSLSMVLALVQLCPLTALAVEADGPQITDHGDWGIAGTQYETFEEAAQAYAPHEPGGSYEDFPLAELLEQVDEAEKDVNSSLAPEAYFCHFPKSIIKPYLPDGVAVKELFTTFTDDSDVSSCSITYSIPFEPGERSLVYLSYRLENGSAQLREVSVRGEMRDSLVTFTPEERTVEVNLLGQDTFRPTDAQVGDAFSAVDSGDFDRLDSMEEVTWFEKDGVIYLGADSPSSRAATKTAQVFMLNELKENFPPHPSDQIVASRYVYSVVMEKDLLCKTVDNWGEYTKSVFMSKTFAEKTSVEAIRKYFGILLEAVTDGLSAGSVQTIVVNGIAVINEALVIQFANRYYAAVSRRGYVYDTTKYNDFVRVYYRSANAEFDWVYYGSDEVGQWEADTKNVFENSASQVCWLSCASYELHIRENLVCEQYRPD